jgi:hypothetical protein
MTEAKHTDDDDQDDYWELAKATTTVDASGSATSIIAPPEAANEEGHPLDSAFAATLDLTNWTSGDRMHDLSVRLEREVEEAARNESDMGPKVLAVLETALKSAPDRSRESGVYSVTVSDIEGACKSVLFNGLVEACDGTRVMVSTLPVTVMQIGVCLASYSGDGDGGSIVQRLYRRDFAQKTGDAEAEVLDFLNKRARHNPAGPSEFGDDGRIVSISDMMCRALMMYGERAMLAERSTRPWRLGHGSPMPHEMIVGSGKKDMIWASLDVLTKLLLGHKKFAFVPSEINDLAVRTIANALHPLQYAVIRNSTDIIDGYVKNSSFERPHYKAAGIFDAVQNFRNDVANKVVLCVYRASAFAPGGILYAHEDHVHEAALIVLADSALQEHRGFPNLIDVADRTCRGVFSSGSIAAQVQATLARAGSPFRFAKERDTRN